MLLESARSYHPFFLNLEILDDGWELFQLQEEYNKIIGASTDWRISSVNQGYKVGLKFINFNDHDQGGPPHRKQPALVAGVMG